MAYFPFDSFGIGITVVDKGTGGQATLYAHNQGADIGGGPHVDSWYFPDHQTFDYAAGILDDLGSDDRYRLGLGCALKVKKGGCDGERADIWRYDETVFDRYGKGLLYQPPPLEKFLKCSCGKEWQCYWDLKLEVRLYELFDEDTSGDLAPLEQLRFLENLVFV